MLLESNWREHSIRFPKEKTMTKEIRTLFTALLFTVPVLSPTSSAAARPQDAKKQRSEAKYQEKLVKEVRHQLVLLPWYSVFDNLAFKVEGDKVSLFGQVVRPTLKSDAEAAVKSIEGVASVENNIEVLPLSPMDDQLRRAVYRAIYGDSGLSRYSIQAVPSIHIIVKNGNVTLEGVVDTEADKNLANLRASQVPNVFSVKNNLVTGG
jgi:hyperosmotically inducible protein